MSKSNLIKEILRNKLLMEYDSKLTSEENSIISEKKERSRLDKMLLLEKPGPCDNIDKITDPHVKDIYEKLKLGKQGHFPVFEWGTLEEITETALKMIRDKKDYDQLNAFMKCKSEWNHLKTWIWSEFKYYEEEDVHYLRKFDQILAEKGINLDLCYNCMSAEDKAELEKTSSGLENSLKNFKPLRKGKKYGGWQPSFNYKKGAVPEDPYVDIPYTGDYATDIEMWNERMRQNAEDNYDGQKYGEERMYELDGGMATDEKMGLKTDFSNKLPGYAKNVFVDPPENWMSIQKQLDDKKELETQSTYPNYCGDYKDFTLPIPENPVGATGEDAVIRGHCYYPVGKDNAVWIPRTAVISFFKMGDYDNNVNKLIEKGTIQEKDRGVYKKAFQDVFPLRTVLQWYNETLDGGKGPTIRTQFYTYSKPPYIAFAGVAQDNNPDFEPAKWTDERTGYEKFVDKYGTYLQWGTAIASLIAGYFTGGATWFILPEIALELGLGVMVGARELDKGEDVSAALSFLFGMVPIFKTTDFFQGLNKIDCENIAKKVKNAGLTKNSNTQDIMDFYDNVLSGPEKKTFSKVMDDPYTMNALRKELKALKYSESNKLISTLAKAFQANPGKLLKISMLERMWFKEIVLTYSPIIAFDFIYQWYFKEPLPPELEEDLNDVFQNIPDEDISYTISANLSDNPEKSEVIVRNTLEKLGETKNMNENSKGIITLYNLKKSFKENNVPFKDTTSTQNVIVSEVQNERSKKLKNDGWTLLSEGQNLPTNVEMTTDLDKRIWYRTKTKEEN